MPKLQEPLRPPPPGVSSNFDDPVFLGLPVIVAAGISLPLILFFAAIRIYARRIIQKKWKAHDYIYCLSCLAGIALIAFSIPLVVSKPNGYHAWDIDTNTISKESMVRLQTFAIAYGPVFWLLKLTLAMFLFRAFRPVRWFKNSIYLGVIVTSLVFAAYTIIVAMACGPRPGSDVESYVNGIVRDQCSSSTGLNAVFGIFTSVLNGVSDLGLVIIPFPLISRLNITAKQMRGIYAIHISGAVACLCAFMGVVYRIKSWESPDITGNQIPLNTAIISEVALSLMIPCMPSFYVIWRHVTYVDINDRTTIGTPNMRLISSLSNVQSPITPPPQSKTWRKTHLSIEEIPYRKVSEEYARYYHSRSPESDSRMKALPCTPLPLSVPPPPRTPLTPMSPISVRSMQLPIMLSASTYYS